MNKIKSVLIANRGEIAVRIDKTLKKLGIKSYGIYSHADRKSIHTNIIGNCYLIKSQKKYSSPYLDIDQIISIAKKNKITAIHPGYGFLSENADFALRCENEKIVFIGPEIDASKRIKWSPDTSILYIPLLELIYNSFS